MSYTISFRPDGTTIEFRSLDRPGVDVEKLDSEELQRRLADPRVGSDLGSSLSAVRGIIGRLLDGTELPDDVKHTLALIEMCAINASVANIAEQGGVVTGSEYRWKVLAAQRIMAGDVPLRQDGVGVSVALGLFQFVVTRLLDERGDAYATAPLAERDGLVNSLIEELFYLVGRRPTATATRAALEVATRAGRPPGEHVPGRHEPTKNEVYNALLREIRLHSGSPGGLRRQRTRRKNSVDT